VFLISNLESGKYLKIFKINRLIWPLVAEFSLRKSVNQKIFDELWGNEAFFTFVFVSA
jgi:hypothetical protein